MVPIVGNIRGMTLKQYLADNGISLTQFGHSLGVSEHAVRKWVYGQRTPDAQMALAIERLTEGAVDAAAISPAVAAVRAA